MTSKQAPFWKEKKLHENRKITVLLDGDNIRQGLNAGLGFSDEDRKENLRRIIG